MPMATRPDDPFIMSSLQFLEQCGNFTPGKISFYAQPPNSPDLNILDVGLFAASQSAYYNHSPRNSMEFIEVVERTYTEYPANKVNRIFVTLQPVYNDGIGNYIRTEEY